MGNIVALFTTKEGQDKMRKIARSVNSFADELQKTNKKAESKIQRLDQSNAKLRSKIASLASDLGQDAKTLKRLNDLKLKVRDQENSITLLQEEMEKRERQAEEAHAEVKRLENIVADVQDEMERLHGGVCETTQRRLDAELQKNRHCSDDIKHASKEYIALFEQILDRGSVSDRELFFQKTKVKANVPQETIRLTVWSSKHTQTIALIVNNTPFELKKVANGSLQLTHKDNTYPLTKDGIEFQFAPTAAASALRTLKAKSKRGFVQSGATFVFSEMSTSNSVTITSDKPFNVDLASAQAIEYEPMMPSSEQPTGIVEMAQTAVSNATQVVSNVTQAVVAS